MKGIILAGGTGTRLYPLTKTTNKHLLPVGQYPMIYHSVFHLKEAGIDDILIITSGEHVGDFAKLLGAGHDFGVQITYRVQEKPGGIAEALSLARPVIRSERIIVLLGDNIFEDKLSPYIEKFKCQDKGAKLLLKEVSDPERFGIAEILGDKIVSIEEKPTYPASNYAVTGIYMYDSDVFELIERLVPSERGELEITDVNKLYLRRNQLTYDILSGDWTDAGTFDSYARANTILLNSNEERVLS